MHAVTRVPLVIAEIYRFLPMTVTPHNTCCGTYFPTAGNQCQLAEFGDPKVSVCKVDAYSNFSNS